MLGSDIMLIGKCKTVSKKNQIIRSNESINYAINVIKKSNVAPYVQKLILYGSCARNEQNQESDVDLFLELSPNFPMNSLRLDAIKLKSDVMPEKKDLPDVDLKVVVGKGWETNKLTYYKNVKKDGIDLWK